MVKRIKWTKQALNEKLQILKYWKDRNKSTLYSRKLNTIFIEAIKLIQQYPNLGRETEDPKVKNILAKEYLIFYEESETEIVIVHLWDERQDPDDLIYQLK
ncbi:MAG: type II toxin-antitoxin system RelE/ParE family toxin [Chitinophagaceae bacterium]|nr:type II toxin-antitoxin system RelE/ParE family toxin [Chitinophagaceae bacterium]